MNRIPIFSLPHNRLWVEQITLKWKEKKIEPIPCVIGGKTYHQTDPQGTGDDKFSLRSRRGSVRFFSLST